MLRLQRKITTLTIFNFIISKTKICCLFYNLLFKMELYLESGQITSIRCIYPYKRKHGTHICLSKPMFVLLILRLE